MVRSARLRNRAKFLLVLVLLMLLPLRALAAVTVGFCALGDEAGAAQAQNAMHGHSQHHEPEPASGDGKGPDCSSCVEHCASMAIAIPAIAGAKLAAGSRALSGPERSAASFFPDSLDPPPVGL